MSRTRWLSRELCERVETRRADKHPQPTPRGSNTPRLPRRMRGCTSAVLLAALALTACSAPADLTASEVRGATAVLDLPLDTTPHVDEAARISQEIAWRGIQRTEGDNRLTSPSSLAMSMAQAAEGARTVTLESIDGVLGLTGDDRAKAFGALRQSLLSYDSLPAELDVHDPPESPVVHQASRVLAVDSTVEQPFLDRLAEFYDAAAAESPRDEAQAHLDEWVNRHTAGLIEKSGVEVKPNTVAVLQDALLFGAAWRTPFEQERKVPFTGPAGETEVEGVSGIVTARLAQGDGWTAVRLHYDDNLAADIMVPEGPASDPGTVPEGPAGDPGTVPEGPASNLGTVPEGPASEERAAAHEGPPQLFTHEDLEAATAALDAAPEQQVMVTMPSFDLRSKIDLMAALPEIDLSDLSGIFPGGFGEQWVQQVVLQVSAKGTVGAAVTEMAVAESAPMVDGVFEVDRPYVFRVLDTRTGWPLFLASISDPAASAG